MKRLLLLFFITASIIKGQGALDEMVNPKELIPDIVIDLRYSSADHKFRNLPNGDVPLPKMYTANECLVLLKAANMLKIAQDSLRKIRTHNGISYPQGIGIKIWDGYRPRAVQYLLFAVYPNPAGKNICVKFNLSKSENVKLELLSVIGKRIKVLSDRPCSDGLNELDFDVSGLNKGLYFCRAITTSTGSSWMVKFMVQ